jgi:hypothetical protein
MMPSLFIAAQVKISGKDVDLLHFMLVLAGEGHALTVVEIVTSNQTATNLVCQLFAFEIVVEKAVGSRVGKPRRVTLDSGQNVLIAMCTWANGESVQQVRNPCGAEGLAYFEFCSFALFLSSFCVAVGRSSGRDSPMPLTRPSFAGVLPI